MLNAAINSVENENLLLLKVKTKCYNLNEICFFHFFLNLFQTYNLDCLLTLIQHLLLFSYTVENLKF